MILYLVSIGCSIAALYFWARACRKFLKKRAETYLREDLADKFPMEWPTLLSFFLPRPVRRVYHFLLVNILTAFAGLFHFYLLNVARQSPQFWRDYVVSLLVFLAFLIIPAFAWEKERLRRALLTRPSA
ncbi:MAG TPA: hypothetical protein VFZ35_00740 [Sphingomicrobium sp.]